MAIYLSQRGHTVDLYEKRPDLRVENISVGKSINLALSHRGIKALKSADVFDKIEPLLIPMKGRIIHLSNEEVEFQPYSIHKHEYINSVSRGALNKILMNKAEESGKVQIHFNHSLYNIDSINIMKKQLFFREKQLLGSMSRENGGGWWETRMVFAATWNGLGIVISGLIRAWGVLKSADPRA